MPRLALLFLIAALLSGCSAVTSRTPIADSTAPELQEGLRGVWRSDDGVLFIDFTPAGLGVIAGLEWEDGNHFKKEEMEFVAAERNEWSFLSVRDQEEPDKGYYFGAYRLSGDDHLIFWNPKTEAFASLVESGRLAGKVQRGTHTISVDVNEGAQLLQALDQPESLLDLTKPMTFTRVIPKEPKKAPPQP